MTAGGRLTRGALSSVGVDLSLAAAAVVAAPVMVHGLGAHAYGVYALVTVLAGQLGFLQLGLAPAVTRRVAEERSGGDGGGATERVAWLLALASALLLALAFRLGGPAFFARVGGLDPVTLFAAAAAVAAQPVVGVSQAILLGRERFTALASVRLVQGIARTAGGAGVVAAGGGVAAVLAVQAAIDLLSALAGALAGREAHARGGDTAAAARALLGLGLPFAASGVLAALLVDGEKLAIGWARSLDQLTYYAVPYGAVFRLAIVPAALVTVLAPRLSALAVTARADEAVGLVRRTTRVTAAVLVAAAAPLAACAPEWLGLWLGADFAQRASTTARLLLVAVVVNGIASPACAIVRAGGRPAALVIAYAAELPLHLAVVYALVRGWGITGAAAAWLVRAAVDAAVQRMLGARAIGRPLGDGAALSASAAVLLAFALGCTLLGPAWWGVRLAAGLALSALALARGLDRADWLLLRQAAVRPARGAVAA
ncbi:MAG: oligosaccharide flippase family protein [Vicinamibacteria bacterium]